MHQDKSFRVSSPGSSSGSFIALQNSLNASSPKRSTLYLLLSKIGSAIKNFFQKIGDFFKRLFTKNSHELTQKEIQVIQSAGKDKSELKPKAKEGPKKKDKRLDKKPETHFELDLAVREVKKIASPEIGGKRGTHSFIESSLEVIPSKIQTLKKALPPILDPVMNEFHGKTQGVVTDALNRVFDNEVKPHLSGAKDGLIKLLDGAQWVANFAVSIGDKIQKPLFKALDEYKIETKVNSNLRTILKWLKKDINEETFLTELNDFLKDKLKKEENIEILNLEKWSAPCKTWLFDKKRKPLIEYYKDFDTTEQNKAWPDLIYQYTMDFLIAKKIQTFIGKYNAKFEGHLESIVQKAIVSNGTKITDILLRRVIELFEHDKNFVPKVFDSIVELVLNQTNALVNVEKTKEETEVSLKKLLKKAQNSDKNSEIETQLKGIKEKGEDNWIKEEQEIEGQKAYAEDKFCHASIKKLLTETNSDPNKVKNELYEELAKGILPLILPPKKFLVQEIVEEIGEDKKKIKKEVQVEKEVDGLICLMSEIQLPQEFQDLAQDAKEIAKEIVPKDLQTVFESLADGFGSMLANAIQDIALRELHKRVDELIINFLAAAFEKVLKPEFIEETVAKILPSVQEQLLIKMAQNVLFNNHKEYIPLLKDLVETDYSNEADCEKKLDLILKKIYEQNTKAFHEYQKDFEKISEEDFKNLIKPAIIAIEKGIRKHHEDKSITATSVEQALKGYFTTIPKGNKEAFGSIIENVLFKLGKFGNVTEWLFDFGKSMVSEIITAATYEMQESPHFLFKTVTEQVVKNIQIDDLIPKKTSEPEEASTENKPNNSADVEEGKDPKIEGEKKLGDEIAKTAKLAYDFILTAPALQGFGRKKAATWFVGKDYTYLNEVINRIFQKVLGDSMRNMNLMVRCQETIMKALTKAGERIDSGKKPQKVEKLPTMIPKLFIA